MQKQVLQLRRRLLPDLARHESRRRNPGQDPHEQCVGQAAMQTSSIAQAFPNVFGKVQTTSETKAMFGVLLSPGNSQDQRGHTLNR